MKKNNKKFTLILFLLILISDVGASQINIDSITRNSAFKPGEKLIYSIKYGLVKGGEASMTVNVIPSGTTFYFYAKASAVTTGLATNFAKIYDIYESYFTISTGFPVKAVRNIRENNYLKYNEVFFYRDENYVWSINSGKKWIPKNTHDILSAFYFARRNLFSRSFKKGDIIDITTFFDDQLFPIKIKFKKYDNIRTKFGKINCLKFVPILEKENPFEDEDDFQIWFSNDRNYVPLKIKMKAKIGSFKAVLIDYSGLKNPLGVK